MGTSKRSSAPPKKRRFARHLMQGFAFVVGVAAFLRMPLHDAPEGAGTSPDWPELPALQAPAARAATPNEELTADVEDAPRRFQGFDALADQAFYYVPPATATLQPLAGADRSIAALIDQRLRDLDDFGNPGARADTLYLLGIARERACDYGAAADYFEAFALLPGEGVAAPDAAASLENAIVYRRALGQEERALASAERFVSIFGTSHPRATTRVQLAAAALSTGSEHYSSLRARRLPPAERIQSEVRAGVASWNTDRRAARRAFRRAERTWRRAGGTLMARSPGLSATEWIAELARTREALAEARFTEADRRVRMAARQGAPAFAGRADAARVERWMHRKVRPWLLQRMEGIERAEAALARVDRLGLSSFSVAAAARRGELFADLRRELLEALPTEVRLDEGRFVMPSRNLEDNRALRRQLVEPAIRHFEHCMEQASKTLNYGPWSTRCADGLALWLDRYRQDELIPRTPRTH